MHHRSLCPEKFASGQQQKLNPQAQSFQPVTVALVDSPQHVVMQTALAKVYNGDESKDCEVRILFDTGASHSFVHERVHKALDAPVNGNDVVSVAAFGDSLRIRCFDSSLISIFRLVLICIMTYI